MSIPVPRSLMEPAAPTAPTASAKRFQTCDKPTSVGEFRRSWMGAGSRYYSPSVSSMSSSMSSTEGSGDSTPITTSKQGSFTDGSGSGSNASYMNGLRTTVLSNPNDESSSEGSSRNARSPAAECIMNAMSGTWLSEKGTTYSVFFTTPLQWICLCCDEKDMAVVKMSLDDLGFVWWGKGFFTLGAEAAKNDGQVRWYRAEDKWMQSPSFVWTKCKVDSMSSFGKQACSPAPTSVAVAAAQATEEIKRQLLDQGGEGRVWLPHWNQQYHELLGSLRNFLTSRPDEFNIIALPGSKKYTVAVVGQAACTELRATKTCLANLAVTEIMKQVVGPGSTGVVVMPEWNEVFSMHLGSFRSFIESRPEFVSIRKRGGKFSVALAQASQHRAPRR